MKRGKYLFLILLCCFLLLRGGEAFAGNRWIEETLSANLIQIMRDEIRDRIYLADAANKEIVVIDSKSEKVIKRIPLPGSPLDMALSKENRWLAVIADGNNLVCVDLNKLNIMRLRLPTGIETTIRSVAFDYAGRIFVIDNYDLGKGGWAYLLSRDGKRIINKFGVGQNLNEITMQGLIKTDATGTVLYVGMVSYSPGSLSKIDVNNAKKPIFLAEDLHGEIGENMRDFDISPRYDEVYVASGGTYGIQVLDSSNLHLIDIVWTQPYPASVDVDRNGNRVYSTGTSSYDNNLYEMDATPASRGLKEIYPLVYKLTTDAPQPRGVAIDRFGEKAFIIHGSDYPGQMRIQVVDIIQ